MKKILISCFLSGTFIFTASGANIVEKTNIEDLQNLVLLFNIADEIIIQNDADKQRIHKYLKLLDFNNKSEVVLAISHLENEINLFEKKY